MSSDSGILVDAFSPPTSTLSLYSQHRHHHRPLTPPFGVPTPPTSHIDLSSSTLPSNATHMLGEEAPSSDVEVTVPVVGAGEATGANGSPSVLVTARRTARQSERSAAMQAAVDQLESGSAAAAGVGDTTITPCSEREAAMAEAQERTSRRERKPSDSSNSSEAYGRSSRSPSPPRDRSRTPSPILGEHEAHLSANTINLLGPSPVELAQLLFDVADEEVEYEPTLKRGQVEEISAMLQQLYVSQGEQGKVVEVARKLAQHSLEQDDHIASLHAILHQVRLRAISSLTSQRTQVYASLTSTHLSMARQTAELEGARSQARMLGTKLARAEARVHEGERARARSVDEELRWADAMRGHAGAWAQQQAARAQAAAGAQALLQQQQQAQLQQAGLGAAFELNKPNGDALPEDGENLTGLGISAAANVVPISAQMQELRDADESGPLASLVRERNKLLSDKRYLKSRVRDVEAQRERLENELKDLRPLLVRGGTKVIESGNSLAGGAPFEGASSTTTAPGRHIKRGSSRRKKLPTMGDAEAELLLLAARRLREVRRGEAHANAQAQPQAYAAYAAHPTLSPQKRSAGAASSARFEDTQHVHERSRPHTPPPGSAPPKTPRTPKTPRGSSVRGTPRSAGRSGLLDATMESGGVRGVVPRWGVPLERCEAPFSTSKGATATSVAAAAAAGNGIEDLLHAAQSLTPAEAARAAAANAEPSQGHYFNRCGEAGRESSPGVLADSGGENGSNLGSPKRRRVSTGLYELGPRAGLSLSPDKQALELGGALASSRRVRTATEGADPASSQALSALDLLADQAAASQQPSQASDRSLHSDERHSGHSSAENDQLKDDEDEGMAIDDQQPAARWNAPTRPGPARYGGPPPFLPHQPPPPSNAAGYAYGPVGAQAHWASRTSGTTPYNYASRGGAASPSELYARHADAPRSHASGSSSKHAQLSQSGSSSQGSHSQSVTPSKPKGGNTSPDKRLPYIRWSEEEDRKLTKAIREHGQRWEAVARSVGTRSYHQCRQRALLMRRKGGGYLEGTPTQPTTQSAASGSS